MWNIYVMTACFVFPPQQYSDESSYVFHTLPRFNSVPICSVRSLSCLNEIFEFLQVLVCVIRQEFSANILPTTYSYVCDDTTSTPTRALFFGFLLILESHVC